MQDETMNPWMVNNINDFLHYCCPECEEKCNSKETFVNHAKDKHEKFQAALTRKKSLADSIDIPEENGHELNSVIKELQDILLNYNGESNANIDTEKFLKNDSTEYSKAQGDFVFESEAKHHETDSKSEHSEGKNSTDQSENVSEANLEETPSNKCEICDFSFQSESHLEYHIQLDHLENSQMTLAQAETDHDYSKWYSRLADKRWMCRKCSKLCQGFNMFEDHFHKMHEGIAEEVYEPKHFCNICDKVFAIPKDLNHHMETKHVTKPDFHCPNPDCNYKSSHETGYKLHLRASMKCDICAKTICSYKSNNAKEKMKSHMKKFHSEIELLHCTLCSFVTKEKGPMKQHMAAHRMCDICGKDFGGSYAKRTFQRHMDYHNKKCSHCELDFEDTETLKNHFKTVHDHNSRVKKCLKCSKTFNTYLALKNHKSNVHGEVVRKKKIPILNASTRQKIIENDGKIQKCQECEMEFTNSQLLIIHLRNAHRTKWVRTKLLKCKKCEKTFSSKKSRQAHETFYCELREDMNVEKYKCDICKYEFVHEKTRDEHVKRGNCKKFYDDDSLNHHCKICGRGFSQVRSYKRHMEEFHKVAFLTGTN